MRIQRFDSIYLKDFFQPLVQEPSSLEPVAEEVAPPPPPTFSLAQLEDAQLSARKEGFAEGFEAGYAESQATQAAREEEVARAMQSIMQSFEQLHGQYQAVIAEQQKEVASLALLIAKKIVGASLQADAMPMIEAMVNECVPMVFGKPRITIELHSDLIEPAHERLKALMQRQGYEGDVTLRANNALDIYDVRVDWASGHAERRVETLWIELETLIQSFSTTPPTQE